MMKINIFIGRSSLLDNVGTFIMCHTYFIAFVWSSLSISSLKPCKKVNNIESGVKKIHAFLQPCYYEYYLLQSKADLILMGKEHCHCESS